MNEQWIRTNLEVIDYFDGTADVILRRTEGGAVQGASLGDMVKMFTGVSATYAALSATPQASQGWQTFFDEWKAAGIL